jgi:hypothetical protein
MRDIRQRQQKGLDAALKRLWPNGDGPANPARPLPASPPPVCDPGAPTRPLIESDPALRLRAPRNSCALAVASVVLVGAWLLTAVGAPDAREVGDAGAAIAPFENLTVRGAIRIVDEQGNLVAQLGSIPASSGEGQTMALELRSPGVDGSRETVRLESLASGAALSLKTPDRRSSVTMVSGEAGAYLLMAQGSEQRLIGTDGPEVLPAVGTGPAAERELDLLDRRAQALGEGLFAVDLRVTGGRLRGRILNTTSVRHSDVEVELALAEQRLVLAVPVISPANSTGFSASLPAELPDAMLRGARVASVRSTLHYDAHQPGSESAPTR